MKQIVVISFCSLLTSCMLFGVRGDDVVLDEDSKTTPPVDTINIVDDPEPIDATLEAIDAKVQTIENKTSASSSLSATLENESFCGIQTDEGCSLTAHYFNGELLKMTSWYGFSNGYQEIDYYLENGQLIKAIERRFEWVYDAEKDEFDYNQTNKNFDGQYYFQFEKLIHEVTVGHNRFENDEINAEEVLLQETEEYINKFKN